MKTIGCKLPDELFDELVAEATAQGMSVSDLLRRCVQERQKRLVNQRTK